MMTRAYFSRLVISTQYVDLPLSGLKRHTAFTKTNTFPPPQGRNPRGGQGGTIPPKILGGGDDIAHIPPNKLSAQLRKITICLDNRMKCNFYRLLQRNEKEKFFPYNCLLESYGVWTRSYSCLRPYLNAF